MPITTLPDNHVKRKLRAGQNVLGTWSMLSSPNVVNVIGTTGLDFVIIDMEHGPMSFETVENMVRAAEATGCSAIVRVAELSESTLLRALETGSRGVMVPHVETPEDARRVVDACRYHPEGRRGLSPYTRNHDYSHERLAETLAEANRETLAGILVEGQDGLRQLDAIAAVPGLDLIYLGVYDISQSAGVPGELMHPLVVEALERCASQITQRGVAAGSFARDLDYARLLIRSGYNFIAYSVDCAAIRAQYLAARAALAPASRA
jgi:4-hydroxy-2-oxoheptanedioate aldolase